MATYSTFLINFDQMSPQMIVMTEEPTLFRLVNHHQSTHQNVIEQRLIQKRVQAQRQTIFHSSDQQQGQDGSTFLPIARPQLESREHVGNNSNMAQATDLPANRAQENTKRRNSSIYKRNGQLQINKSDTHNYLPFIWRRIVRLMNREQTVVGSKWWKSYVNQDPSLQLLSELFAQKAARPHLKRIFEGRYILRQIMRSCIDAHRKKVYLTYLRPIYQGFLRNKIQYLK